MLTLLVDAIHSLPATRRRAPQMERYHYTDSGRFEQSLDVYRPTPDALARRKASVAAADEAAEPPVVALVVGSAWLGHRYFVYGGTSWWNASGPRTVAELGYVCVCIRHRGSFMQTFTPLTMLFITIMAALITTLIYAMVDEAMLASLEALLGIPVVGENIYLCQAGIFVLSLATGVILMELGGMGAASFEDMQSDVMDALAWLNANEAKLGLERTMKQQNGEDASTRRLFVFGGYSSGGHVAATVTQQPRLWKERSLPPPHEHCDTMLYISPVLATKSYHEVLVKKISSLSSLSTSPSTSPSTASLPSLSPSEASGQLSRQSSTAEAPASSTTASKTPTWLTDGVVKSVFGSSAPSVPSPILTCENSPPVPHIFLGCKNEMFGLNWLDTFFCSPRYCELLNGLGIESRYTAVRSDHWNILNSDELSFALRRELGRIEAECSEATK